MGALTQAGIGAGDTVRAFAQVVMLNSFQHPSRRTALRLDLRAGSVALIQISAWRDMDPETSSG